MLTAIAAPAVGDDRDLLRTTSGSPYVMLLLDTSGSMNWSAKCTQAEIDGTPAIPGDSNANPPILPVPAVPASCTELCLSGDCAVARNGDDRSSKMRQAKEAMHEVLKRVPDEDVFFGFSSYNQDQLAVLNKNWLYRVSATQPAGQFALAGGMQYPALLSEEVFGATFACSRGGTDGNKGCRATNNDAADLDDSWELQRVRRLSKLGPNNDQTVRYYIRTGGQVYWIQVSQVAGQTVGAATLRARVEVRQCNQSTPSPANGCDAANEYTLVTGAAKDIEYERVGDFVHWDFQVKRAPPQNGFFGEVQSAANGTCLGWDPVDDSNSDPYPNSSGYSLKHPTVPESDLSILPSALRPRLNRGDVIPLDWRTDNKQAILERFAPRLVSAPAVDPLTNDGFATAAYLNDKRVGADGLLKLRSAAERPLVANGATPLGFSVEDFRNWYAGCNGTGPCPVTAGWRALAAANDPDWSCKQKFLIVITDGDDTCPGRDPCEFTKALLSQEGVKTYVVAFGVDNVPGNKLNCMASEGGTGTPIYARNKQQLVAALTEILGSIVEEARSFASAAVPAVQVQVTDKVYLTNFTPLNSAPVWDGHVDAYLKPLPLTAGGRPDKSRACSAGRTRECFAWDAGKELLDQAPDATQILAGDRDLGFGADERRVFYGKLSADSVPAPRRLFDTPVVADRYDLWSGLGIAFTPGDATSETAAAAAAKAVIDKTLVEKTATVDNPNGTETDITYVLGDLFHGTPQVIGNPDSFEYYVSDLPLRGTDNRTCDAGNIGYRCFSHKHRCRRKLLLVGSNDGQLHAFDAGTFDGTDCRPPGPVPSPAPPADPTNNIFTLGTGQEVFSFIPRGALPVIKSMFDNGRQEWSVDGTVTVTDAFLDPVHDGTPDPLQREWRTIAVGGMREGGRWYYALDITQPDTLDSFNVPGASGSYVPNCVGPTLQPGCGPLLYPSVLWEFRDPWDEDTAAPGLGRSDLGDTWSIPTLGRIRVCTGSVCDPAATPNDVVDKYVAVVGGGMDELRQNRTGNWLYMIDVETGKAIYKRRLEGSAPSEPAAVDTNADGYIDTIYIGTTAGYLYKASVRSIGVLESITVTDGLTGQVHDVQRVLDPAWEPFKIFDTINPITLARSPIYYPPAVIFVAKRLQFAVAFGTGDRENLWLPTTQPGRFYVVLDENFDISQVALGQLPRDESDYFMIDPDLNITGEQNVDFLVNPTGGFENGWFFDLEPSERVVNKAFTLSGVTIFSSFQPRIEHPEANLCARGGDSRVFAVFASNANPLLRIDNAPYRYRTVDDEILTAPVGERNITRNTGSNEGDNASTLTPDLQKMMENLKTLFPDACRFGALRVDIRSLRSDTGVETIAAVPVCHVEKNWKDF